MAKAYLIGEAAEGFAATLGDVPHVVCGTLEAAVRAALAEAEPGETVLLAPACASFDQFASFEARGEAFGRWCARCGCASGPVVARVAKLGMAISAGSMTCGDL